MGRLPPGGERTTLCVADSSVSVVSGAGPNRTWDTGGGAFGAASLQDAGWLLAYSQDAFGIPTGRAAVLDRVTGDRESLGSEPGGTPARPVRPQISDSARLVVTASVPGTIGGQASGWLEYTPEDGE